MNTTGNIFSMISNTRFLSAAGEVSYQLSQVLAAAVMAG
jgi:hypothetical protein